MSVVRKEAYFTSCNGYSKIRTLIWADDKEKPRAVVQIAHGLCEHIGRYDEFARFLVSKGFAVCGNDHLGHGKSSESLAQLGQIEPGDHVNMLRDMNTLYKIMSKRYPKLPYILFGHSMGSFLARIYSASFSEQLAGAIYCGTMQLPEAVLAFSDPVELLLSKMPPESTSGNVFSQMFAKLGKKVLKETDDLAWLSRDKDNIQRFRNDTMCGFPMPNCLTREVVTLAVKASDNTLPFKLREGFPCMFISGGKDGVGMYGKGVISASDLYAKAGLDPEVILYPGDRHEILFETDREKVFDDILEFIEDDILDED